MVKSSLACGLQECLSKEWMGDNFRDFRVVVDGSEYFCHKFILSACSSFFRGLFRTNLREKQEERVKLHDMSKETFDVIINSIYKGVDGLTMDNVLNLWQAVHLLDISFLIQECEIFVMENMSLDNYITYYHMAKLLQSETVINFSIGFMKKHFEHFQNTETFLELSFPLLFSLIDDDSLNVNSEDLVLESIIKWVLYEPVHKKSSQGKDMDFQDTSSEEENSKTTFNKTDCGVQDQFEADVQKNSDNETKGDRTSIANKDRLDRKECIVGLLSTARTFLASRSYLERILIHPLIKSFDEAHEIVYEALLYQSRSVSFPTNFFIPHRNCSGKRNVMVFVKSQKLHCFELNSYNNSKPSVKVHCYNIYTKSTQDVNFEGPANHIKSFSTGARKTFILQKNGALRSPEDVDSSLVKSLPGIIGRINVVEIESESNLVPLVIPESWLTQP
ncbi:kelch-like protein 40 [Physella acuta]|uniref:kelch-like protein 40 n=1 Tax=Physella acuta TaxID=109671 RepID=UPI0027DD787C|nr:kelch-like protein 40 [Physella acuta]